MKINQLILISFSFTTISTYLDPNEFKISIDLFTTLQIRQCILFGNAVDSKLVNNLKRFSSAQILSTFTKNEELRQNVMDQKFSNAKTAFVFKLKDFQILRTLTKYLNLRVQLYKMCQVTWIIFVERRGTYDGDMVVTPDCQMIIIGSHKRNKYTIVELYTIEKDEYLYGFGKWNEHSGLTSSKRSFYERRSNLYGNQIHLLTTQENCTKDDKQNERRCKVYQILDGLANMMNVTIIQNFETVESFSLQEMAQKLADITDVFVAMENASEYDKLGPISTMTLDWYIEYPNVELRSDYYLQPFDGYVWLTLLGFILAGTAIITLLQELIHREERFFSDDLFIIFESFCNQCGSNNFESVSLRTISIVLRLLVLILLALYSSTITSFIAVEIPVIPFQSLREFSENGQYKLLVPNNSAAHVLFLESDDDTLKKIYNNLTEFYNMIIEPQKASRICHEKLAILWMNTNNYLLKDFPCPVFKIPRYIRKYWMVLLARKDSPYTKTINHNIFRFFENGIQKRIFKLLEPPSLEAEPFQPIELSQIIQVLSISLIGIILAALILMFETMYRYCVKRKSPEINKMLHKVIRRKRNQLWARRRLHLRPKPDLLRKRFKIHLNTKVKTLQNQSLITGMIKCNRLKLEELVPHSASKQTLGGEFANYKPLNRTRCSQSDVSTTLAGN